jgi:hypothetical protein
MPWYKQKTSWIGLAMLAGTLGAWISGEVAVKEALVGLVTGVGFIVLQGAVPRGR